METKSRLRILLAGNPNCGKTCIFNQLTGARQHVGNYPGVTVESKSGTLTLDGTDIELIDLPGVYSMSSLSPEEKVALDECLAPGVDAIINVVDATILQRSLYYTAQLAELHVPMLVALNMSDEADRKGINIDLERLSKTFGIQAVRTVGTSQSGIADLLQALSRLIRKPEEHGHIRLDYGNDLNDAIDTITLAIDRAHPTHLTHLPARFFAIKLLEQDADISSRPEFASLLPLVQEQLEHLTRQHRIQADTFIADQRHAMVARVLSGTVRGDLEQRTRSDRIDAILTHRWLGLPIFLAVMYLTFWVTFTCGDPLMGFIEDFFGWLGSWIGDAWNEETMPFLRSLVIDGVISGVGGVIVFLPNILLMFLAIAFLEDSGYMARAAFVMDGVMRRFGLQGRSFVPLVLGFGCSVPAIMATRCIESDRDRKTTIMVLPLMSCGARLPIYSLLIPAFFPLAYQPLMMWVIYLIGVIIALIAARLMKATLFKGDGEVFIMEMPPYRLPTLRSVMLHMWDRGRMYLHKAGTIILATSIILYLCNTFPERPDDAYSKDFDAEIAKLNTSMALSNDALAQLEALNLLSADAIQSLRDGNPLAPEDADALAEDEEAEASRTPAQLAAVKAALDWSAAVAELKNERLAEQLEYTISGRIGHTLEPLFRPLGFDWRVSTSLIGALAAKEVFVAQLGILFSVGEADEESADLRELLARSYSPLQAFCMMVFCLLSIPCLATLAIIRRELNSTRMAVLEGVGLFLLAWIATCLVYQIGSALNLGTAILS